jgi:15-cis-phytoene synthase/lycopene beta-cyclase
VTRRLTSYSYSFCRAADDLIDDSPAPEASLLRLRELLDIAYSPKRKHEFPGFIKANFPEWAHAPLLSLPSHKIPRGPFDGLLDGFEMDMSFPGCEGTPVKKGKWPIRGEEELWSYCSRVAGTVGEMFFSLVMTQYPASEEEQKLIPDLFAQAGTMGIALQLVNIARDIEKDSMIGRVYIPGTWLKEAGLTEEDIMADPSRGEVFKAKLLAEAEKRYQESIAAVEMLPEETRGGAKVAIECYMDIGRRMQTQPERKARWKAGKLQRIFKAWKVMNQA